MFLTPGMGMGDDETGAEASFIEGKFEDPASEYLVDRLYSKRTRVPYARRPNRHTTAGQTCTSFECSVHFSMSGETLSPRYSVDIDAFLYRFNSNGTEI